MKLIQKNLIKGTQEFELLEYLSVLDNILLPYRINSALRLDGDVRRRAEELAGRVGIADKLGRHATLLSQGEMQRVAVARALAHSPDLLLADEPTGNLDEATGERVTSLLVALAREHGTTMLIVTHSAAVARAADRVLHLQQGRLTAAG